MLISVACMLPTALATFLVVDLTLVTGLVFAMGETEEQRMVGGVLTGFVSLGVLMVCAPLLSLLGFLLHPLGAIMAGVAMRTGAKKLGLLMIPPHLLMLLIDFMVVFFYGALILEGM